MNEPYRKIKGQNKRINNNTFEPVAVAVRKACRTQLPNGTHPLTLLSLTGGQRFAKGSKDLMHLS